MKNKNIQFRATTGVVIPLLVACLGIFVSAATPASARDQVPFNGIVSGTIISTVPLDECHVLSEAVNGGNAMQLGRFNGTAEFVLNVCDLTYVGSYVFTGANGDSISGPFTGTLTPTPIPGVFDNNELAFITAGTGRFDNATGTFNLSVCPPIKLPISACLFGGLLRRLFAYFFFNFTTPVAREPGPQKSIE